MIARFDGATDGSGFSTTPLTRCSRPWSSSSPAGSGSMTPYRSGLVVGHLGDRDDRGVGLVVDVHQLADRRSIGNQDVVGQDHRERLVADQLLGHEHRVAETKLLLLADVGDLGEVADVADAPEHLDIAALLEQVLELVRHVEVVLDRPLLARGHDDDLFDAGGDGLLDRVLDDRFVDEREHLLGLRLRGRQEASAPSGGREDGFADSHRTPERRLLGGALTEPSV